MANKIVITKLRGTWVVRAGGAVLGESRNVLELREADYEPVIYFPRRNIGMAFLEKSDTTSRCPFKGDASYYSIHTKSRVIEDAGWSYETPIDSVSEIKEHLAFSTDKVTVEEL